MDPEHEAQSILDRLNTAVLTCDEQLRVVTMNPAGEAMFGISARQAHKRPLSSLLPVEPEALLQPVAKAQTTRQPVSAHGVALCIDPGRHIKVDLSATPLTAPQGDSVLIELYRVDAFLNLARDRDQLVQAILNITRNAVDAVANNGEITFRTRIERSAYTTLQGHRCVIKVDIEDNGPGIPEHMHERIFYPMVSGRAEGSGLGLSIAQDIVNKHQGSIRFQSEPGRTCFSLLLPFNTAEVKDGY